MITKRLSEIAEGAGERYLTVIFALRGSYDRALSANSPLAPQTNKLLSRDVFNISRMHLESEEKWLEELVWEVASQAITDALQALDLGNSSPDGMDALSDHLSAIWEHLRSEIAVQLERDASAIVQKHRKLGLQVKTQANATGWSESATLIHLRMSDRALKFYFQDRAGRKWPSQKYVRTVYRGTLLALYNEVYLFTLAERGQRRAMIWHSDPNHRYAGTLIALDDDPKLTTYESIKEDAFHPNSDAVVRAVTQE